MPATQQAVDLARSAAEAAQDKAARDVVALDVSDHLPFSDIFLIASAPNERQVSAIVDAVLERMLQLGRKPARREGEREARWVLLDFTDIVVHVMHTEDREFYDLERLWKDGPEVALPEPAGSEPTES